jgi:hypothetical protein
LFLPLCSKAPPSMSSVLWFCPRKSSGITMNSPLLFSFFCWFHDLRGSQHKLVPFGNRSLCLHLLDAWPIIWTPQICVEEYIHGRHGWDQVMRFCCLVPAQASLGASFTSFS